MGQGDYAILSKPIPTSKHNSIHDRNHNDCDWNLVFTRSGKYFFYNDQSGERCWIPPVEIIESMKKILGPTRMEMFFDPFYTEEGEDEESEDADDSEADDGSMAHDSTRIIHDSTSIMHDSTAMPHSTGTGTAIINDRNEVEGEFKLYLLKNSVDPFAPWPSILAAHSASPEFLAIPSDRRRQELFAQLCPLLIDRKRELSRKRLDEAKDWWLQAKEENWRVGASWFQVIKKVKGNQKFALLNEKECEKEYKNKK